MLFNELTKLESTVYEQKEIKINKAKFDKALDYHGLLKNGSIIEEDEKTGELHFLDKKGRKCYFGNIKDFEEKKNENSQHIQKH